MCEESLCDSSHTPPSVRVFGGCAAGSIIEKKFCPVHSLFGQVVTITTNYACPINGGGQITLELDPSLQDDYPFTYDAEWENISDGEYENFTINSLAHVIENLTEGDYEIIIFLDEYCELELDATLGLNVSLASNTCICDGDGAIELAVDPADPGGRQQVCILIYGRAPTIIPPTSRIQLV